LVSVARVAGTLKTFTPFTSAVRFVIASDIAAYETSGLSTL
jgi:hypothetical protein